MEIIEGCLCFNDILQFYEKIECLSDIYQSGLLNNIGAFPGEKF